MSFKTMSDVSFKGMSDIEFVSYLRGYGKEREGELSLLITEAADRLSDHLSFFHDLREDDDCK